MRGVMTNEEEGQFLMNMNSKFYKEYLSQVNRLNGIARVVAPPKLSMIVVDENKDQELPEYDSLTEWDLVLKIEKPPIQGKVAHS